MADFNKVLTPGDYENGEINVVIEIPTGSNHKIEWDREHACFMLDRVEPMAFAKPCNYGFIPQTIDEDGDELDALVITEQPLTTGIWLKARVLGVMKFVDGGEVDDKIICVPADDRNNGDAYQTLEDLPKQTIKQIEFHFNHYKDLKKPGTTEVKAFEGVDTAKKVIADSVERYEDAHPGEKAKAGLKGFASGAKEAFKEIAGK
jgi:inorganic pyrophosphatase